MTKKGNQLMFSASSANKQWVLLCLMGLMAVTRFHHTGSSLALPDASLAVFFLGGFYLRSALAFIILLAGAASIDYAAIAYGGVDGYCISPAYLSLLLAYASLWGAGWWSARAGNSGARSALWIAALFGSVSVAFLISEYGFYLFSGRFGDMSWERYSAGVFAYYPDYVTAALAYCVLAFGCDGLIRLLQARQIRVIH
jgi:hypothetical protein